MKDISILNNYVCTNPFKYLDVQTDGDFLCCPSWCPVNIGETNRLDWFSDNAEKVRESVLDGTYKYCDHSICPSLNLLINNGDSSGVFIKKNEFDIDDYRLGPENIVFSWDRSCNLKCPSCRSTNILNDTENSIDNKKYDILKNVEDQFGKTIKKLFITGSGDPFYSNIYRNYLKDFDKSKYPNLEEIQIITNGNLLNEKMWNSLKASPFIKLIEISVDAGTKETYETVSRLNGQWDKLITNLKFLSTLKSIKFTMVSMVVSQYNYKEMETFYKLMYEIFEGSTTHLTINFRQLVYWESGKYTEEEVKNIQVFNIEHELHNDFKNELLKIHNKPCVNHNFNHLL